MQQKILAACLILLPVCLVFLTLMVSANALSDQELLDKLIESKNRESNANVDCELRFPTEVELEVVTAMRSLSPKNRLSILEMAVEKVVSGEVPDLPLEYLVHAAVGKDPELRDQIIGAIHSKHKASPDDKNLEIVTGRIGYALDALKDKPELAIPIIKSLLVKMTNPNDPWPGKYWQGKLEDLIEDVPSEQRKQVFEFMADQFLILSEGFVDKTMDEPAEQTLFSREIRDATFRQITNLSILTSDFGCRLSDSQLRESLPAIKRLEQATVRHTTMEFRQRLTKLKFESDSISRELYDRRAALTALLEGPGAGNMPQRYESFEEIMEALSAPNFQLRQAHQFIIPAGDLDNVFGPVLATHLFEVLKTAQFSSRIVALEDLTRLAAPYLSSEQSLQLIDPLLAQIKRRSSRSDVNGSVYVLSELCKTLQGDDIDLVINKILEKIKLQGNNDLKIVMAASCENLSAEKAKLLLARIEELGVNFDSIKLALVNCFPPQERQHEFDNVLQTARENKNIVRRFYLMNQLALFEKHAPETVAVYFQALMNEVSKVSAELAKTPSSEHPLLSIPNEYRERLDPEEFIKILLSPSNLLDGWHPNRLADGYLKSISKNADLLTEEQAISIGKNLSRIVNEDKRQHRGTLSAFATFVENRPAAERAVHLKEMIPTVVGGNFRNTSSRNNHTISLLERPIQALPEKDVLPVFLAALTRSMQQKQLDTGDSYLLYTLATRLPKSERQLAGKKLMEVLEVRNTESFLVVYTRSLSAISASLKPRTKLQLFTHWKKHLTSRPTNETHSLRPNPLGLANVLAGLPQADADNVYEKILDLTAGFLGLRPGSPQNRINDNTVRLFQILHQINPEPPEALIDETCRLLSKLASTNIHPTALEDAIESVEKLNGHLSPKASETQLETVKQLLSDGSTSLIGEKLLESYSKFAHPDNSFEWASLATDVFTNEISKLRGPKAEGGGQRDSDDKAKFRHPTVFSRAIPSMRRLTKQLNAEESKKIYSRFVELKEFIKPDHRRRVQEICKYLLANIGAVDMKEMEADLVKMKSAELFPASFNQQLETAILKATTDEAQFVMLADQHLKGLEGEMRMRALSQITDIASEKPVELAVNLLKHYGSAPDSQLLRSFLLIRVKPTHKEFDEINKLAERPDSVGFISQFLKQRSRIIVVRPKSAPIRGVRPRIQ